LDLVPSSPDGWIGSGIERTEVEVLQDVTDDLRARLQIDQNVQVTIVEHNPLVMSVETLAGRTGPFVISIDRDFISQLNHQESEAAIAHELGHVWIYTHHPFLQTERLANDIAMRVISRAAFEPVYEKVWQRTGIRGNLAEFLGPPAQ
jgi:predicted Zn-dependent protease